MERLDYSIENNQESEIDVSVYMGACNNAQVMFWMVPEVEEPSTVNTLQ